MAATQQPWIYGFMPQCESFQGWGVSIPWTILTKTGWWEWRGNGLSSLNNYHQGTLTQCPSTSIQTVFTQGSSKVSMCAAERGSKKVCALKTSMKYKLKNIKPACGLMRNRPEELNCLDPFSPRFKNTMTGQEIDNIIAYFGAYFGQFVIFWQHALSLWIALLSIQKASNWTDWLKNEFCLTKLEKERQESSMKCFHLGMCTVTQLKRKYFPFHSDRKDKSWCHQVNYTQNWILT